MANDIAFNIARMVIQSPYQVPSNRVFYGGYAALDVFLLLLIVSIFWQLFHLKGWSARYQNVGTAKRVTIWIGMFLEVLLSIGLLILPLSLGTRWHIMLFFRPDLSIPLISISICLGALGLIKIIWSVGRKRIDLPV
jgi:hypothetical protein